MELSFQIFSGMAGVGFRLDIQCTVDNLASERSLRVHRLEPTEKGFIGGYTFVVSPLIIPRSTCF
jgi:hypothetical protein